MAGKAPVGAVSFDNQRHELWDDILVWDLETRDAVVVDSCDGGVQGVVWLDHDHLLIGKFGSWSVWHVRRKERVAHASFEEFEALLAV